MRERFRQRWKGSRLSVTLAHACSRSALVVLQPRTADNLFDVYNLECACVNILLVQSSWSLAYNNLSFAREGEEGGESWGVKGQKNTPSSLTSIRHKLVKGSCSSLSPQCLWGVGSQPNLIIRPFSEITSCQVQVLVSSIFMGLLSLF